MTTNRTTNDACEIGDDLRITKIEAREAGIGGAWVSGTIAGHRFEALVFADHAEEASYEMDQSRISKLWIQRLADREVVTRFDRGWDLQPTTLTAAEIADFLAAGLAEAVYHA